jgi:hypothetical protein
MSKFSESNYNHHSFEMKMLVKFIRRGIRKLDSLFFDFDFLPFVVDFHIMNMQGALRN